MGRFPWDSHRNPIPMDKPGNSIRQRKTFICFAQVRIQPVSLGESISVIFGIQVSLRVPYCKRDEVYFTTLLWQNQARNQLGTPGGAKSFLRGAQIFELCPVALTYVQHIFQGTNNFSRGEKLPAPSWLRSCTKQWTTEWVISRMLFSEL